MFKNLIMKYKDIISYLVFGVMTTVVNVVVYWFCSHLLGIVVVASSVIAWTVAVLFAYITNRKWVFYSEASGKKEIIREMISFFSCRFLTGVVDWLFMFVFVVVLCLNDVIIKVVANILVIVLNYIASKFLIFLKR